MKEIKDWCKEHEDGIAKAKTAVGVVLLAGTSFWLGAKWSDTRIATGFGMVVAHNPEIKTMIEKASEEIKSICA